MFMYINNIFVAHFILRKMLFACKIKRFQLSCKLYIYIKIRSLFEISFGYGVSYVLVICISIHLYACNEITVDSFKHCCR